MESCRVCDCFSSILSHPNIYIDIEPGSIANYITYNQEIKRSIAFGSFVVVPGAKYKWKLRLIEVNNIFIGVLIMSIVLEKLVLNVG